MFSETLLILLQVQCDVTHVVTGSVRRYSCCYMFSETLLILLQVQWDVTHVVTGSV